MRITERQLRQLIREQIEEQLAEGSMQEDAHKLLDDLFKEFGKMGIQIHDWLSSKGIVPKLPRPGSGSTLPDMGGKGGRHPGRRRRREE
jgi:hypothetical protein